jgi:N-acetylglucosamine kinase-like BadF-type ATPase
MAGYRYLYDGSINSVGTGGSYWSSTISDTRSRGLGFVIGSSANIMEKMIEQVELVFDVLKIINKKT